MLCDSDNSGTYTRLILTRYRRGCEKVVVNKKLIKRDHFSREDAKYHLLHRLHAEQVISSCFRFWQGEMRRGATLTNSLSFSPLLPPLVSSLLPTGCLLLVELVGTTRCSAWKTGTEVR